MGWSFFNHTTGRFLIWGTLRFKCCRAPQNSSAGAPTCGVELLWRSDCPRLLRCACIRPSPPSAFSSHTPLGGLIGAAGLPLAGMFDVRIGYGATPEQKTPARRCLSPPSQAFTLAHLQIILRAHYLPHAVFLALWCVTTERVPSTLQFLACTLRTQLILWQFVPVDLFPKNFLINFDFFFKKAFFRGKK